MHDLDPLDPAYVADVLSKPPFVTVPGVINVRDLGSYLSTTFPGKITKPRHLYRSAEISGIKPEGTFAKRMLRKPYLCPSPFQERLCSKN